MPPAVHWIMLLSAVWCFIIVKQVFRIIHSALQQIQQRPQPESPSVYFPYPFQTTRIVREGISTHSYNIMTGLKRETIYLSIYVAHTDGFATAILLSQRSFFAVNGG